MPIAVDHTGVVLDVVMVIVVVIVVSAVAVVVEMVVVVVIVLGVVRPKAVVERKFLPDRIG